MLHYLLLLTLIDQLAPRAATAAPAPATPTPPSYEVRFTSVNGEPTTQTEPLSLTVRPGDVITFGVDVFKIGGACQDAVGCPQSREIEEFEWQANDRPGNVCKPALQSDCLSSSDFQLNNYGISFYVPSSRGPELQLTVTSAGVTSPATIVLKNSAGTPPPPTQVTALSSQTTYEYDSALAGNGRWVYISGVRHWVPYTYQANWTPYQNGYWVWVEGDGLTWISYDPWGFCTDHYGVWRHHLTYGWIWQPFAQKVYRPAVVSWFYGHNYIGWYPYYSGYPAAYKFGYQHGFNDGYWAGTHVTTLAANRAAYTFGLTATASTDFAAKNIFHVRADPGVAAGIWGEAASASRITATPDGKTGSATRSWVEDRLGESLKTTRTHAVQVGSTTLIRPQPVEPVPPAYQNLSRTAAGKTNVPVGSMIIGREGQSQITPPTANGKSLTHSPAPQADQERTANIRTRAPAVAHPGHPYADRLKLPKPAKEPAERAPAKPKKNHNKS